MMVRVPLLYDSKGINVTRLATIWAARLIQVEHRRFSAGKVLAHYLFGHCQLPVF